MKKVKAFRFAEFSWKNFLLVMKVVFVVARDKKEVFVGGETGGWQISRLDRTSIWSSNFIITSASREDGEPKIT